MNNEEKTSNITWNKQDHSFKLLIDVIHFLFGVYDSFLLIDLF